MYYNQGPGKWSITIMGTRNELEIKVTAQDVKWEEQDLRMKAGNLPSRFQISDQVTINFYDAGKVVNCEIIKVHFTDRKVLYDVEVMMNGDDAEVTTRLYNIDSCFVEPAE